MRRLVAILPLLLLCACQGGRDDAPPAAGSGHNTLGTWPNVVVVNGDPTKSPKIDDQKTAADLLYEILAEAVVDANDPKLGPAKFLTLVGLVQRCGRNVLAPPHPISAHGMMLIDALEKAKLHTAADWNACITTLDHGH